MLELGFQQRTSQNGADDHEQRIQNVVGGNNAGAVRSWLRSWIKAYIGTLYNPANRLSSASPASSAMRLLGS